MKILHLVRAMHYERVLATMRQQQEQGHDVTLVLLHDATLTTPAWQGTVLACRDDVMARTGHSPYALVDYSAIVGLIFDHARAVCW